MPTIAEVRQKFPQYDDMSDEQLAGALHQKFYADLPEQEFRAKLGLASPEQQEGAFDGAGAFLTSVAEGVPIAGPAILGGLQRAGAAGRSLRTGRSYDESLAEVQGMTDRAQENHPVLSTVGGITGAVAGLAPVAATGAGAAALGLRGGMMARTAASTASGAAIGGADSAARGGDIDQGAATGAIFGAAAPAAGKVVGAAGRAMFGKAPAAAAPSTQALKAEAGAGFEAAKDAGLVVRPRSLNKLAMNMVANARGEGIDPTLHPKAHAALMRVAQVKDADMPLSEIITMRRIVNDAAGSLDPADQRMALRLKDMLDDHLDRLTYSDVAGTDPKAGLAEWKQSRELWHRARKAEDIEWAIERAKNAASGFENGLRSEFRSIAGNKRKIARYTKDEQEIILGIVRGTRAENLMQKIGRSSLMNGILMPVLMGGGGGAMGGPAGMVAGLAVPGAVRAGITARTASKAANLSATVRNGGPIPPPPQSLAGPGAQLLIQGYGVSRPSR